MKAAWRASDIRAAEAELMATLPPGTLMQRAGTALARRCAVLLADRFGGVYGRHVLVLAGAGDNGGDALFAGATLARRGAEVSVVGLSERVHAAGLTALRSAGGRLVDAPPSIVDIVVDGIVGLGGRAGLREPAARAVEAATRAPASDHAQPIVVAVDLPSGVDVDTGAVAGPAVHADVTVTFGALKPALVVGPGAIHSGLVELVDIGLGPYLRTEPAVRVPELTDIRGWWPSISAEHDKYSRGVLGVATGSSQYPGAAVLSVAGALAGPVGMVRYTGAAADLVRARFPSVVASERVQDAGRVQAWVCGCGLGTDERAQAELRAVLASDVPVCVDADGLTLLAEYPGQLSGRSAPTVLTPHDREFARLAGEGPDPDRVGAAANLAARMNVVVLLKGNRTVVATPDGRAYANPTGSPVLATGGTGDVLAGLLGSLLAGGLPVERAALAAAYVHGLAGRRAAREGPPTALDVAQALRGTLAETRVTD